MNLIRWCDENISILKSRGIRFADEFPVLPEESIYKSPVSSITTFTHRNDISNENRNCTIISFFAPDMELFPRLEKMDEDILTLRNYAGICGFDLSPCVAMLRIRQKFHLLISAVYNCRCAVEGIQVLPNIRMGDLGTVQQVVSRIPHGCNFITGELGCRRTPYKTYGLYQLREAIRVIEPKIVFVYGSFQPADAEYCAPLGNVEFIVFPDRRSGMRNQKMPYRLVHNMQKGIMGRYKYQNSNERTVA